MQVKEKQMKTSEVEVITEVRCDFCDKEIEQYKSYSAYDKEGPELASNFEEVCQENFGSCFANLSATPRIELDFHWGYSDGWNSVNYYIDICPLCFKEHLLDKAKQYRVSRCDG